MENQPITTPPPAPTTTAPTTPPVAPPASTKKKLWPMLVGIIAIIAIVAGVVLYFVNRTSGPAISPKVANVSIQSGGFSPSTIQIQKGQEITFTNQDSSEHNLGANQTQLPDFGTQQPLQAGDAYTYIFNDSGTFHYYDSANPQKFTGTVTVK